jgi:hypothetical protein
MICSKGEEMHFGSLMLLKNIRHTLQPAPQDARNHFYAILEAPFIREVRHVPRDQKGIMSISLILCCNLSNTLSSVLLHLLILVFTVYHTLPVLPLGFSKRMSHLAQTKEDCFGWRRQYSFHHCRLTCLQKLIKFQTDWWVVHYILKMSLSQRLVV